ncbi:DUF4245 family protein [Natronoglycomyces albus]|uniref:DUF4245 family protein n=1 Tax=Natronoglycomyces albus TaxID=2811108 RepID=A0A895XSM6_9ACTN|nr:DUF4245 family protein [Natronoglycomyces albus]QSB04638.1 DUF4245 family protein [Natronoglycomyces albus]
MSSSQREPDAAENDVQDADQGRDFESSGRDGDAAASSVPENSEGHPRVIAPSHMRPKQRRFRDMSMSLAVLLVPLALVFVAWNWLAQDRSVSMIDPSGTYVSAQGAGLDVRVPQLSDDWKPISQAFSSRQGENEDAVVARVGWYSPEGEGYQVVQTTASIEEYVSIEFPGGATLRETTDVAGERWTVYLGAGSVLAWVSELDGVTVAMLAQQGETNDIEQLAAGLAEGIDVATWTEQQFQRTE